MHGDAGPVSNGRVVGEPGAIHVLLGAESTRIVLSGEIDDSLSPDFLSTLGEVEKAGQPIEVDAHHVTFMDSSGVAFLVRLAVHSAHRVRVLRVPPTVRFLFEVTRLSEVLDIDPEPRDVDGRLAGDTGPRTV